MLGRRYGLGEVLALVVCLSGCGEGTGPAGGKKGPAAGDSGTGGEGLGGAGLGGAGAGSDGFGGGAASDGSLTRAARLTHAQYQSTILDLFGLEDDFAASFAPDAQNGFAFDSSINFVVDSRLAGQYRTAAETIAAQVVSDADAFARVVPCDTADDECRDEFISSFGLRVFRRPLTQKEVTRLAALFDEGESLVESGDAFADGVLVVVEAMLQSPDFLYRTELQPENDPGEPVPLSSYEIASRISYFLYGSMPDAELLLAAERDELLDTAEVRRQVKRLLDVPETLQRIVSFHEQAFDFGRYARISLDPDTYPDAPSDFASRALSASRLFVEDVVLEGGGLPELLTAPYAYADSGLAPLYGAAVDGDFQRIELDPQERAGLLTQVGFLASHAYAKKTDPIHRGLFVVRNLLCQAIPDPPAGASMTPPPEGAPVPKTTREEIEILTGQSGCTGCHSIINPAGFAFESFDAAGVFRDKEGEEPVDTLGRVQIDGEWVDFEGAPELVSAIAQSGDAQACYLGKWLEFAHGRELAASETEWAKDLPSGIAVLELLPKIVSDPSFLTRPASEVSP
jgi:hypothetical protein